MTLTTAPLLDPKLVQPALAAVEAAQEGYSPDGLHLLAESELHGASRCWAHLIAAGMAAPRGRQRLQPWLDAVTDNSERPESDDALWEACRDLLWEISEVTDGEFGALQIMIRSAAA